ncbi:ABC transporter substrate-binding protein [Alcaligenaceae bacterium]|nr:ABC transporter substrate-binding protein [Alcaligenaceae bacterium]
MTADVIKQLAPTGVLRVAINFGNIVLAQPDPVTGKPQGVSVDLAHEVAKQLGLPLEFVTFDSAGKVFAAVDTGVWDMAFMAVDPVRAEQLGFTSPYVIIEGTYMVQDSSPLLSVQQVDRGGVKVAVGKGTAYDLFLSRALQQADIVRAGTSAAAIDLFIEQGLDTVAGVRQPLLAYAQKHPGLRVMDGRFTAIEQAMAVPKANSAALVWLSDFIEQMKASGFVKASLQRSGQTGASVAPAS